MANKLFNLARMTTATTGTGTITLGSAVTGYLSFADAGISNGDVVSYAIKDGGNSEIGTGTYASSGTTLTRTVTKSTNSNSAISLSGSAEVFITPRAEDLTPQGLGGREVLTADRTYYVRTDGSDSNNGLSNTSGSAFKTIQKAVNVIAALDLAIYNVTIQVAAGTYNGAVSVTGPWIGSGAVLLLGDATTPSNVVIDVSAVSGSPAAVTVQAGGRLNISGVKIVSASIGLASISCSVVNVTGTIELGANTSFGAFAANLGLLTFLAGFRVSGAGGIAALAAQSMGFLGVAGVSCVVSGTPAFSFGFAYSSFNSFIAANSFTFTGTGATGPRYSASAGGGIYVAGGGANVFPGNASGSATSPGWYQ